MINIIRSPEKVSFNKKTVFLAGSIDNGASTYWYDSIKEQLDTLPINYDIDLLNPRREKWDATLSSISKEESFVQQVSWELNALEKCDLVIFNILGESLSPISLLEFGLMTGKRPNSVIMLCHDNFWRKGNVDVVCNRYNIQQVSTINELCEQIVNYLNGISLLETGHLK